MKRTIKNFTLFVLVLVSLSMILSIGIGATDTGSGTGTEPENILTKNEALVLEKLKTLGEIRYSYAEMGDIGKNANTYIYIYEQKINILSKIELEREATTDLINLYYEQGITSGHLALIFYTYENDERLSDEAKEAIKEMHTKLQNDVAASTSATELAMIANELFSNQGIYAQMHVMIYNKLLGALIKETDSSEVVAKVAIAKEDIKSCTVVKTNEQYEEIYNRALREVTIQRNKDNTVAEINKIFEILCPGLDIHENNAAMIAIEFIGRDTTVEASEMNARLKEIADALLAEKKNGGKYVDGYIDKLLALVAETVAAADEKAEAAVLSTLLENYALDIKKAETKDAIAANISERAYGADEEMAALEAEYNADGGIIDGCANEDDLAFEKDRAALRADLYGKYVEAATSILSFGEFSELADEAKRKYDYYDYNIMSKDRAAEGAAEACREEYDALANELDSLVITAESTAFASKHADILAKELADVTAADKDAVLAAIADLALLSDGSKEVLKNNGTIDKLAEKYKEIAKQAVDAILGDSSKTLAYELKDQIGKLPTASDAEKLTSLVEAADVITKKAELAKAILDHRDGIKSTEDYGGFSDENKQKIEKIAADATLAIVGSAGGEDAENIADHAKLSLDKAEACAKIDAAVTKNKDIGPETFEKIVAVANGAKDAIGSLTSAEEIDKAVDDALFAIDSEGHKNLMDQVSDDAKDVIADLGFVSEEDKNKLSDQIDKLLSEQKEKVDAAESKEERAAAIKEFDDKLTEIKNAAEKKNNEGKSSENEVAFEALDKKYDECIKRIDALEFLTEDQKSALKTQAEALNIASKQKIEAAENNEITAEALEKALSDIETLAKNAELDDEKIRADESRALDAEIKDRYDEVIKELETLEYISDLIKNELKIKAGDAYKAFTDSLLIAKNRDNFASAKNTAYAELDEISDTAKAQDLVGAKLAAMEAIREKANEAKKKIVGFKHLAPESKNMLTDEIDGEVDNVNAHVEIAPDIPTINAIKNSAYASISSVEAEGQKLEDEAFVRALMPLIIALTCIGVVEAIIAIAIFIYKKKTLLAIASPMLVPALAMNPMGAQVIAITLAVIDLALAVYIGYWIVILYHAWKRYKEDEEEEPVFEEE